MSKLSATIKKQSESFKPHKYQQRMMRFLLENGGAALFAEPGLGKTSVALGAMSELKRAGMMTHALVIAPLRVVYNVWEQERDRWTQFNGLTTAILHGPKKERALESGADIYLTNPETLPWLMSEGRFKRLEAEVLVVDESTKFKNQHSQRFKLLKPVLGSFSRRWIMTGTPTPNGFLDLFAQAYLVDRGHALGQFITYYRTRYFFQTGYMGYDWKLKPGADKEIMNACKPFAISLKAEDYLELPKLVNNIVRVTLPAPARKAYDQMEEELFAELENGKEVTALSASGAAGRCCQIANGGVYREELKGEKIVRLTEHIHDAKTEALEDLVEQSSGPVLVTYEYQHDLERIKKGFPKAPVLGGGTSPRAATEIIAAWNRKELPLLLGHPASMGHGLNLQSGGSTIVMYSVTYDYELYQQVVRRVLRQGAKFSRVIVHHIIATNTVDEAKLRALDSKARTQNGFLDALRTYRRSKV